MCLSSLMVTRRHGTQQAPRTAQCISCRHTILHSRHKIVMIQKPKISGIPHVWLGAGACAQQQNAQPPLCHGKTVALHPSIRSSTCHTTHAHAVQCWTCQHDICRALFQTKYPPKLATSVPSHSPQLCLTTIACSYWTIRLVTTLTNYISWNLASTCCIMIGGWRGG